MNNIRIRVSRKPGVLVLLIPFFVFAFLLFSSFFGVTVTLTSQSQQLAFRSRSYFKTERSLGRFPKNYYDDEEATTETHTKDKVVLGIVTCGAGSDRQFYIDQTAVMIKSVLISAELYNVPVVEFHHFLEHPEDEKKFRKIFWDFGYPTEESSGQDDSQPGSEGVKVKLYVYSLKDVRIPEQFVGQMLYHPRFRCGFVRFYYSTALPQVDTILHMDSDVVITGNVMEVYDQFSKMDSRQMIGAVNDMEPENDKFPDKTEWVVGEIPHLTKNGFNSGLLWMNLTRMREYKWEERFTRVYQDYSRNIVDTVDQQVLNIIVYFNPDLILSVDCNFNFGPASCEAGLFCHAAESDPLGIQLVHGNAFSFRPTQPLHGVYKYFQEFEHNRNHQISTDRIKQQLMTPIRNWYQDAESSRVSDTVLVGKCRGSLNRYLFPNFF